MEPTNRADLRQLTEPYAQAFHSKNLVQRTVLREGFANAVIADRCPQIQETVVDVNAEPIAAWNDPDLSQLAVDEPGLANEALAVLMEEIKPTET